MRTTIDMTPLGGAVDELLFPEYSKQISFAMLSFDLASNEYYGDFAVLIDSKAISSRATVFEENSFGFIEKNGFTLAEQIPPGHRAVWEQRGKLAATKLVAKFSKTMTNAEMKQLLVQSASENGSDGDFVEVHIYGGLLAAAIEAIVPSKKIDSSEKHLVRRLVREASLKGIELSLKE